ncbi:hypothetical protein E8E13_003774 [Curvularia kusanoi]|uniref:Vacuolar protein sorting-associated protein 62 n=1 Tax=Curvularia kusanoi TaxID=90978 RepID=A0A9P4WC58_CURKU|nr:hypothetical protein E8E13_003774 [Curvularia kusanoi]
MGLYYCRQALLCLVAASFVGARPTQPQVRQLPSDIPEYVLKYAPILYLHSAETKFPTDLDTFLTHTTPKTNYTAVAGAPSPVTLLNLNSLGTDVYLTSNDDPTTNPAWLGGTAPDSNSVSAGNNSVIIINEKPNGSIDVFYFYFYAYNPGTKVLDISFLDFGYHVGDWEHTMLRFASANLPPEAMWYSQHANGQAFRYSSVEKDTDGIRPVAYVAKGSHANYAIPGAHSHVIPDLNLPFGALEDHTDKGKKWDTLSSSYVYRFNAASGAFTSYGDAPVDWLQWKGHWGDKAYPTSDPRQRKLFGQNKYGDGPTGPVDKQLNREKVCPDNGILCIVRSVLVP